MTRRILSGLLVALSLAAWGAQRSAAAPPRPVPILMYHHIAAAPAGERNPSLWVRPATLRGQLAGLARAGYAAVTLERVHRAWDGGAPLPAKPVVLSFDDGYDNQVTAAGPILRARGWPGVLFLQTGRLGVRGGVRESGVRGLLARGWELGGHTATHPDLTRLTDDALATETADARQRLQQRFGVPVASFAYPFGRTDPRVRAAVQAAGFSDAATVRHGLASPTGDPFTLRRIKVGPSHGPKRLVALLRRAGAR